MKKLWLIAFNILTFLAWVAFFIHSLFHGLQFDGQSLVMLAFAQGLAIFEIMNAVLGIAGAHWLLTTVQVFSRFLVVALLLWMPAEHVANFGWKSGFAVITVAWTITEMVRALYYLAGIFNQEVYMITFCRYSFFVVLYPLGVAGEFMVMYCFWDWREWTIDPINVALALVALSYFVGFPKLFGHMLKQRKKKLA
ncbi:MAG: hypothetical protein EP314_03730 [Bacteroidetes bacterium]|nr:MAG: hypothetical protein EP314_03730 [Bacteroidota bacterium]